MQFVEPNIYIADKGKVFRRISDGINPLNEPQGFYYKLTLGKIFYDQDGLPLDSPIKDDISFYEEIEEPISEMIEMEEDA